MSTSKSAKFVPNPLYKDKESTYQRSTEVYVSIAPDGGWGWWVVLGAFFSYLISDGLMYSFGIFLKDIADSFGCLESQVSLAGAICSCLFCISGPFSAALVNRYGYRKISLCGSVLASTSCLITSFATSIYTVVFVHGIMGGIGFGMIYITAMIAVGFYFEKWRAIATGIAVSGAGIGGLVLPQLFSVLLGNMGWRYSFRVLSCMTLMVIICSILFKPIKPTKIYIRTDSSKSVPNTLQRTNSSYSKYNNAAYSKILEMDTSTATIVGPGKLMKNQSSELMLTTYNNDVSNITDPSYRMVKYSGVIETAIHNNKEHGKCWKLCCGCRKIKTIPTRPMYRDDILYSGSIINLPEYKKSMDLKSKSIIDYQLSVTRASTHEDMIDKKKCCPIAFKRILCTMLDVRLLQSPKFLLLVFNAMFSSLGFYTPYIFIKDSTSHHGIGKETAFWLISTMGITNTVGRIVCGILSTHNCVNPLILGYTLLMIGGISTILSTLSYKVWVQFVYCAVYGFAMSSMSALRTIIVVDMFGLKKLTNAIGMILMFQGIATLAGISASGYLKDFTGNYKCTFYSAGACISIGAVFLFVIHMKYYVKCANRSNDA